MASRDDIYARTEEYRSRVFVGVGDSYETAIAAGWEFALREDSRLQDGQLHKSYVLEHIVERESPGLHIVPMFINH